MDPCRCCGRRRYRFEQRSWTKRYKHNDEKKCRQINKNKQNLTSQTDLGGASGSPTSQSARHIRRTLIIRSELRLA